MDPLVVAMALPREAARMCLFVASTLLRRMFGSLTRTRPIPEIITYSTLSSLGVLQSLVVPNILPKVNL